MADSISICNVGLLRIGNTKTIASLNEDNEEGRACKILYPNARDVLLAAGNWNFARRQAALAAISGVDREDWEYGFTLPADYLSVQGIWAGARRPSTAQRMPFDIELSTDGTYRTIFVDEETPTLIYTARVENAALYSPAFCDALSWVLSRDLAMALAVKPDIAARAEVMAERALSRAASISFNESHDLEAESEFITGRG